MAFTGYLKIEDIKGESKRSEHEGEIDVYGVTWGAAQASSAATGSGRSRGRATVVDLTVHKWYDASSPYLAKACMQGAAFDEIVFTARKDSGDAHLDYLVITMKKCIISHYDMNQSQPEDTGQDMLMERVGISFEEVGIKYTVQADDHSAGDEHEIEYNIVAAK